jgi:hypothetical protein
LSQLYCSVGLNMGGRRKTFTLAVTTRVLPSVYIRSKMGIALEVSPKLSGNRSVIPVSMLLTVIPSCSTSLPPVNSLTQAKEGYAAIVILGLILELIILSYVQVNHLMVMESVYHGQMAMVTILILKVERTC